MVEQYDPTSQDEASTARATRCAQCRGPLQCRGDQHCWCMTWPQVMPLQNASLPAGCLCPTCLRAAMAAQPPSS
ncbi:hypothetical protein [Ferrimonas pelagia]|uniref:hypothetical protein n=1 Tax=Ferrimonas pelagia TaxID=1177826 RepID=UPI0031EA9C39